MSIADGRSQEIGRRAESIALRYLEARGLQLIARNYRCRAGELDLVMRDQDELVVAEIRYRRNNAYGSAVETVDRRKQRKLVAATSHFLITRPELAGATLRFDVVGLSAQNEIQWIRDAFRPD